MDTLNNKHKLKVKTNLTDPLQQTWPLVANLAPCNKPVKLDEIQIQ